jgi:hypothetical protein
MPIIATGKATMQQTIKQAFIAAKENGSKDGADPDAIVEQLSSDIASAVDAYVTSITVIINPGIPVAGTATIYPVVASTTAPGSS